MRITTPRDLNLPPYEAWLLLSDSRLAHRPRRPAFCLGMPSPRECSLPDGERGQGAARDCRSEQGAVRQRITPWEPPERLSFHMESTDLVFERYVDRPADEFVRVPRGAAARITRTTVVARGPLKPVRYAGPAIGVKSVHRLVFRSRAAGPSYLSRGRRP
jgi:hypothetical protein